MKILVTPNSLNCCDFGNKPWESPWFPNFPQIPERTETTNNFNFLENYMPKQETFHNDTEVIYCIEMPGVTKDKITASIKGNILNISYTYEPSPRLSNMKLSPPNPKEKVIEFTLPMNVDVSTANLVLENGILYVSFQKTKPKELKILTID